MQRRFPKEEQVRSMQPRVMLGYKQESMSSVSCKCHWKSKEENETFPSTLLQMSFSEGRSKGAVLAHTWDEQTKKAGLSAPSGARF